MSIKPKLEWQGNSLGKKGNKFSLLHIIHNCTSENVSGQHCSLTCSKIIDILIKPKIKHDLDAHNRSCKTAGSKILYLYYLLGENIVLKLQMQIMYRHFKM